MKIKLEHEEIATAIGDYITSIGFELNDTTTISLIVSADGTAEAEISNLQRARVVTVIQPSVSSAPSILPETEIKPESKKTKLIAKNFTPENLENRSISSTDLSQLGKADPSDYIDELET